MCVCVRVRVREVAAPRGCGVGMELESGEVWWPVVAAVRGARCAVRAVRVHAGPREGPLGGVAESTGPSWRGRAATASHHGVVSRSAPSHRARACMQPPGPTQFSKNRAGGRADPRDPAFKTPSTDGPFPLPCAKGLRLV